MKKSCLALLPVLLLLSLFARGADAEPSGSGQPSYRVQPGDVLDISVWKEEDLKQQVLVRPDGGISFPLAGDIQASNKTITEIRNMLTDRLQKYIPDPIISAAVIKLDGNKIYVLGQVNRPGEFVASRYLDVIQALSVAGGMTPYASENKILVLRRNNGKLVSIPFKYGDVEKGKNLQQDIILQSGDIVLVP
jgi:polysaccharide export outer membrane protein